MQIPNRIMVVLVALFFVACSARAAEKRKPSKTPETGTVRGIVKFKGKQIPAKPVIMNAGGGFCVQAWRNKKIPLRERWKWGKNDTLQNVVVYVSKGLLAKKFPMPKAVRSWIRLAACMCHMCK